MHSLQLHFQNKPRLLQERWRRGGNIMIRNRIIAFAAVAALTGMAACADRTTSVPSRTSNPTTAQQTRDAMDPARGPAEAAGRAMDRASNPNRP